MLLLLGIALLIAWALGLIVFHLGAFIYVALVAGIAALVFHWWTTTRSTQRQ